MHCPPPMPVPRSWSPVAGHPSPVRPPAVPVPAPSPPCPSLRACCAPPSVACRNRPPSPGRAPSPVSPSRTPKRVCSTALPVRLPWGVRLRTSPLVMDACRPHDYVASLCIHLLPARAKKTLMRALADHVWLARCVWSCDRMTRHLRHEPLCRAAPGRGPGLFGEALCGRHRAARAKITLIRFPLVSDRRWRLGSPTPGVHPLPPPDQCWGPPRRRGRPGRRINIEVGGGRGRVSVFFARAGPFDGAESPYPSRRRGRPCNKADCPDPGLHRCGPLATAWKMPSGNTGRG